MPTINGRACAVDGTPVDKVFNNGKQVYGRNLLTGTIGTINTNLKIGYINKSDGGILAGGSRDFYLDNYIATNGATIFTFSSPDYVFKGSINNVLAMYDSDNNYLGYQLITSPTQTLNKSNTAYIRFSINFVDEGGSPNRFDWLSTHRYKLEKGSVATPWTTAPEDVM